MKFTVQQVECEASLYAPEDRTGQMLKWLAALLREQAKGAQGEAVGRYTDGDRETIRCLREWVRRTKTGERLWGQCLEGLLRRASSAHPDDVCLMPSGTAPRASVPPERISEPVGGDFDDITSGQGYRRGWNDCRKAMLSAAPSEDKDHD